MTDDHHKHHKLWPLGLVAAGVPAAVVVMGALADSKTLVDTMGWLGLVAVSMTVLAAVGLILQLREPRFRWSRPRLTLTALVLVAGVAVFSVRIIPFYTRPGLTLEGSPGVATTSDAEPLTPSTSIATTTVVTPTTSAAGAPPIQIESIQTDTSYGQTYALASPLHLTDAALADLDQLSGSQDRFLGWMATKGAVPSSRAVTRVVARGVLPRTVVISDIKIVKQCDEYLTGALLYSPPAGQDPSIAIRFDLDQPVSTAKVYESEDVDEPYFQKFTISLEPGETTSLVIHAQTRRLYCKYYFLFVVATGESATPTIVRVDNAGRPFEVTATADTSDTIPKFAEYDELYAGGVASPGGWRRVEDPASFPGYVV